jgi:hypothetical protein
MIAQGSMVEVQPDSVTLGTSGFFGQVGWWAGGLLWQLRAPWVCWQAMPWGSPLTSCICVAQLEDIASRLAAWLNFGRALLQSWRCCWLSAWLQVLMEDFLEGLASKVGAQP